MLELRLYHRGTDQDELDLDSWAAVAGVVGAPYSPSHRRCRTLGRKMVSMPPALADAVWAACWQNTVHGPNLNHLCFCPTHAPRKVLTLFNGLQKSKDKYCLTTREDDIISLIFSVCREALLGHSHTHLRAAQDDPCADTAKSSVCDADKRCGLPSRKCFSWGLYKKVC